MLDVLSTVPLAVVEIGGDWALLVFAGCVFIVVLGAVLFAAFLFTHVKKKPGPAGASTFELNFGGRLPVSKTTFDGLEKVAVAAVSRPEMTPERRSFLDWLSRSRAAALNMYRISLFSVGLVGIVAAAALWRDATPANMQLLPASIILLFSLGAIFEAWIPNRRFRGSDPPAGSFPLNRINVNITKAEPDTLTLTNDDIERVRQFMRQGLSLERAASAAYSGFSGLDEFEKRALLDGLQKVISVGPQARP